MTKKLITLISAEGESPEEISKQAWDAYVKFKAEELGLKKCDVCGEYKGDSNEDGETITAKCICEGILCTSCKKVKIHRPISNYFSIEDAKIWHVPFFYHICTECKPILFV